MIELEGFLFRKPFFICLFNSFFKLLQRDSLTNIRTFLFSDSCSDPHLNPIRLFSDKHLEKYQLLLSHPALPKAKPSSLCKILFSTFFLKFLPVEIQYKNLKKSILYREVDIEPFPIYIYIFRFYYPGSPIYQLI